MVIHQGQIIMIKYRLLLFSLVHTTDNFVSDVSELLLVLRVPHVPDVLHGGVLVLLSQQLGLPQSLRLADQTEGGLGVSRLTEPPEYESVELAELLTGEQHGGRGQAQLQVGG